MALALTSLYLKTRVGLEGVADLLGPVFEQQCAEVGRGALELRLVEAGGWIAVLGAEALEGRTILTEALSRELGGRALLVELLGGAYRYRVECFDRGAVQPGSAFEPSVGGGDPMPLYVDAEAEAYRALSEAELPEALSLLSPDASGAPGATLPLLALRWDGRALARFGGGGLRTAQRPAGSAPVVLTRIEAAARRRTGIEPRAVAGRVSVEALRRLLELEAACRARLQAVEPEFELRFLYRRSNGDELDVAHELDRIEHPSALRRFLGRRG